MLPELGNDSPKVSLLRMDPATGAATFLIQIPSAFHFPPHTHKGSETTFVLAGAHVFEDGETGTRYEVKEQGYFYMPPGRVHQAWVPAGTLVLTILEGGLQADWIDGPPSAREIGLYPPP